MLILSEPGRPVARARLADDAYYVALDRGAYATGGEIVEEMISVSLEFGVQCPMPAFLVLLPEDRIRVDLRDTAEFAAAVARAKAAEGQVAMTGDGGPGGGGPMPSASGGPATPGGVGGPVPPPANPGAAAVALGRIAGPDEIENLTEILNAAGAKSRYSALARSMAAVALGRIAARGAQPILSRLSRGFPCRATCPTFDRLLSIE